MAETVSTAEAAGMLRVTSGTIGRLSHTFRLINEKDARGRTQWRADVIRKAADLKANGQRTSVEKLLEAAVRQIEG